MTASMAIYGSLPFCLASISAWPMRPYFVVDRFARSLKPLLMLIFDGIEQFADDSVVQANDFIGHGVHAMASATRVA